MNSARTNVEWAANEGELQSLFRVPSEQPGLRNNFGITLGAPGCNRPLGRPGTLATGALGLPITQIPCPSTGAMAQVTYGGRLGLCEMRWPESLAIYAGL
eukprot:15464024-Alexandrium_andersonii.AAC.1